MTAKEYEAKVNNYDWQNLEILWGKIQEGDTKVEGWEAGKALEYLIVRGFELELTSKNVTYPFDVDFFAITKYNKAVEQIDGVVYANGLSCILECKDYGDKLDVQSIAKLRNQLARRPAGTIVRV